MRNSARYDPSWPVMPVMRARFGGLSDNRYLSETVEHDCARNVFRHSRLRQKIIESWRTLIRKIDTIRHVGYLPVPDMNENLSGATRHVEASASSSDARAAASLGIVSPMAN